MAPISGLTPDAWEGVTAALLAHLDAGWAVKEAETGRYLHANDRWAALLGRPIDELTGHTDVELFGTDAAQPLRAADSAVVMLQAPQCNEHLLASRSGQPRRDFKVISIPLERVDGSPTRHLAQVWLDVTETRALEARLSMALMQLEQQQIANEALIRDASDARARQNGGSLFQRTQFDDQVRREVDLSMREHREFALVSIAIDPPDEIAARLGPAAQLRVVEAIGRLMRSNTRAMDAACRVSEDRFAILLSGVGLATAHARMESLRRQCATQIVVLDGQDFSFSVAMGVASFPHTALTQDELLDASEQALAVARQRGGNRVSLASIQFAKAAGTHI